MNKSKNLRFHRNSHLNHAYSITFCTAYRRPYLRDFTLARTVINAIRFHDRNKNTSTIAFVVMPDHVHWLFVLNKHSLTYLMQSIKSYTAHQFDGHL